MAEDDIYGNEAKYNRFKQNLRELLTLPVDNKGHRKYTVKDEANLAYYRRLFAIFEAKDMSFIRRLRLLKTFNIVNHVISHDLKSCTREEMDQVMAFAHAQLKSVKSKHDFVRDLRFLWKQLFPENDSQGRPDETLVPYVVRHLPLKIDKSKEKPRNDKITPEEFERLLNYFGNDLRMQAFLAISLETLTRPAELCYVKICDVERFDDDYAIIQVPRGKEGPKSVPVFDSIGYLTRWLEKHPLKAKADAFLFVNLGDRGKFEQFTPFNANKHLRRACKYLGINKAITAYSLKRAGVTFRRLRGDPDSVIQKVAGWSSTRQLKTYDQSNIDDVIRLELVKRGFVKPTKNEQHLVPKVKKCIVCNAMATQTDQNCPRCLRPLDREKLRTHEPIAFAEQFEALKQMVEQRLIKLEREVSNK